MKWKGEYQRDTVGAPTVSVTVNISCLVRLGYHLRLELGAYRSWDRLLWGHGYQIVQVLIML